MFEILTILIFALVVIVSVVVAGLFIGAWVGFMLSSGLWKI